MNTAKFNHLYTMDLVSEITTPAFRKIVEILDPIFREKLTWEQANQFISNCGTKYEIKKDFKSAKPGDIGYLNFGDYAFNCYAGIQKDVGLEWMHAVKGTFPKRFASYLYKQYGIKLDTETLSKIGTVASAANASKATMYFDMFNCATQRYWDSGRYGDSGSCLWGGKDGALDIFKASGVMALRTYYDKTLLAAYKNSTKPYDTLGEWFAAQEDKTKWNYGRGRAWVYYAPELDAYIFWNGYDSKGELQAIHYARLWATVSGMTYHKITYLSNNGSNSGTVYINAGSGWIVHAMDNIKASNLLEYDFHFKMPKASEHIYECEDCGWTSDNQDDFMHDHSGRMICPDCQENYRLCSYTGDYYHEDDVVYIEGKGIMWEGHRLRGDAYYNDRFIQNGVIVLAEDTERFIWAKDAYKDEEGFYWTKKPEKESTV